MPEITVVVPCYNVESCLSHCVDSLLKQTLPVEILLVNDGSKDNTLDIAKSYADQYPNVRLISKENQGLPQARRSGLKETNTKYVGFLDSDDWAEPEMFEELYRAITTADADIACCGYYMTDEKNVSTAAPQMFETGTVLSAKETFHAIHLRHDVFPFMWNKLFRRELFEGIVFPEGNFTGEDYVTLAQLVQKANRVVTVKKPLHHYWQSSDSMSRGGFKDSHLLSYRYYSSAAEKLIQWDPAMENDIGCYLSVEYMAYVIAMSRNNNYNYEILRSVQAYVRRYLGAVLRAEHFSLLYKGSAAAFSVSPKILTTVYRYVKKPNHQKGSKGE